MTKTLQDAAFYVDGPGATVVWSKPDNDLYVVRCGEMRIQLKDDVIRNTDQLEKAGIKTDKQPAYFEERMTTEKAVSACKRAIRREINERMKPIKCKRLSYQVTRNWVSWDTGVDVRSIDVMENTDG